MCEPTTLALIGLGLAGAGTVASAQGAQQATNARNAAETAETAQQTALAGQGKGYFDTTSGTFNPAAQTNSQANYAGARQSAIASAVAPTPTAASPTDGMNPNAPRIVGDTARTATNNATNLAASQGNALARIGSFGDLMTGNQIALDRGGQNLQKIASFSQGDANLLPLQLQEANQKGSGLRSLGGLLSSVGSMAGLYGAANGAFAPDPSGYTTNNGVYGPSGMYSGGTGTGTNGMRIGGV